MQNRKEQVWGDASTLTLQVVRQRVRDYVAAGDFDGLSQWRETNRAWQTEAPDPWVFAYMAPVWAYGLVPAPDVDLIARLEGWCPALAAADYALGILFADGIYLPRNVHLARFHLKQGWQTESVSLTGSSCWPVFSSIPPYAVLTGAEAGDYKSKFALAAEKRKAPL